MKDFVAINYEARVSYRRKKYRNTIKNDLEDINEAILATMEELNKNDTIIKIGAPYMKDEDCYVYMVVEVYNENVEAPLIRTWLSHISSYLLKNFEKYEEYKSGTGLLKWDIEKVCTMKKLDGGFWRIIA